MHDKGALYKYAKRHDSSENGRFLPARPWYQLSNAVSTVTVKVSVKQRQGGHPAASIEGSKLGSRVGVADKSSRSSLNLVKKFEVALFCTDPSVRTILQMRPDEALVKRQQL